jgi:hypothetical protein
MIMEIHAVIRKISQIYLLNIYSDELVVNHVKKLNQIKSKANVLLLEVLKGNSAAF